MNPIEQLRALLGKLPNPTEALELLDKVAAVPVVGEHPLDADANSRHDLRRARAAETVAKKLRADGYKGYANVVTAMAEMAAQYIKSDAVLRQQLAESQQKLAAVPVVGEPVVMPRILGVGRDAENPRALIVSFSTIPTDDELRAVHERLRDNTHAATVIAPADSITRARLDELLAAEKRVQELEMATAEQAQEIVRLKCRHSDSVEAIRKHFEDEARKVPEGWRLLPVVPTQEMAKAGASYMLDCFIENYGGHGEPADIYDAMLAAAPQEPKP